MSGLRDKIVEIARTTAIQIANQQVAASSASNSNNFAGTSTIQSISLDTNGNRIAKVLDSSGSISTVFLNTDRPVGVGSNVLIINGNIAQ